MILAAANTKSGRTCVLVGFAQLRLHRSPNDQCWAHARLVPSTQDGSDTLRGDVRLLDEAGRTAVEILGVHFKYMTSEALSDTTARPPKMTLAVTATFTAEPLEDPLSFWMRQFDTLCEVVFAPYSQPFQQLLDPSSLLSKNRSGANVVLIRLEDWMQKDNSPTVNVKSGESKQL